MIWRDLPQPIMLESSDKTFSVQLSKKIPLAYSNNKHSVISTQFVKKKFCQINFISFNEKAAKLLIREETYSESSCILNFSFIVF